MRNISGLVRGPIINAKTAGADITLNSALWQPAGNLEVIRVWLWSMEDI